MKINIFKICLIILLTGFLGVFYKFYREFCLYSQNGRFAPYDIENPVVIINSRTGEIYGSKYLIDESDIGEEGITYIKLSNLLIQDTEK